MGSKMLKASGTDLEDDDSVSSEASLSSASAHTLDNNVAINTQQNHPTAHQMEDLPSYEHATSLSSPQLPTLSASFSLPTNERNGTNAAQAPQMLQTNHGQMTSKIDQPEPPKSKVTVHEGDQTLHSSETVIGPIVITGDLTIFKNMRFIGSLEVQKSLRIHGTLTVDGPLRVARAVNNHNKLSVSETTDVGGKFNNYNQAVFAKHVTQRGEISNYRTMTYNGSVDFCMAAINNYGTINAEHGVSNAGKITNHGKLNGLSSF
nr:hypothetical protein CFP56_34695 [Quercus suber]